MAQIDMKVINQGAASEFRADINTNFDNINTELGKIVSGTADELHDGLMSSEDKVKLDGIDENANNYTLPTASSSTLGGVKVGENLNIDDGVLSAIDTTYSNKTAMQGGTEESLVTTGDKYNWNNKGTVSTTGPMTQEHIVVSNAGTVIKDSGYIINNLTTKIAYFEWPTFSQTESPYSAIITLKKTPDDSGASVTITNASKVDIQFTPVQIQALIDGGVVSCLIGNNNTQCTLYVLGDKDIEGVDWVQVTITETVSA